MTAFSLPMRVDQKDEELIADFIDGGKTVDLLLTCRITRSVVPGEESPEESSMPNEAGNATPKTSTAARVNTKLNSYIRLATIDNFQATNQTQSADLTR